MRRTSESDGLPVRLVVYTSRTRDIWEAAGLRTLAARAGDRNLRLGVTGRLMYFDGGFIQILEGDRPGTVAAMRAIEADPRHFAIDWLLDTIVPARLFATWDMDLILPEHLTGAGAAAARDLSAAPADARTKGGDALALLSGAGTAFINDALHVTPRQDRAIRTVGRILAAARDVGARQGIAQFTMNDVAAHAGIGIKTVYRYFASPAEIARAMVRETQVDELNLFRRHLETALFGSDTDMAAEVAARVALGLMTNTGTGGRAGAALLRDRHDIPYQDLWGLAGVILSALERCGGPRGGGAAIRPRLAMALAGSPGRPSWPFCWIPRG